MTQHKKDTDKFFEWAAQLPPSAPEEKAQAEAELKALEGTLWEWAQMQPNGDIAIRTADYGPDGTHGDSWLTIATTDENYHDAKRQYALNEPGDTFSVTKKLVNGNWVIQEDARSNAKSA